MLTATYISVPRRVARDGRVLDSEPPMSHNFDLQEEYQALQDLDSYELPNEESIGHEEPGRLLEGNL